MYARSTEEFEESIDAFKTEVQHEGFKKRIIKFLDRKEEWAKICRDHLIMRGHHTNNLAEATMRILKDIILERIKAYNVVALVDYIINVWNAYLEAKIMKISHKLDNAPQLLYQNLLSRMAPELADKIEQVDEDTYMVPSGRDKDLCYEVNTTVGVCLCKAGTSGAFCKHQALIHSRFGGLFPNAPAITSYDRYQLGRLALGDKCPAPNFFLDMQEDPAIIQTWDLDGLADQMEGVEDILPDEMEGPIPIPVNRKRRYDDDLSEEDKEKIKEEFMAEWERLHSLAEGEDKYFQYLQTSTKCMKRLTTSTSATSVALRISAALQRNTRRQKRGQIGVQSTTPGRRSKDAPRTNKRLPAGRRKGSTNSTHGSSRPAASRPHKGVNRKAKRSHQLSQSVKNNVRHVTKH